MNYIGTHPHDGEDLYDRGRKTTSEEIKAFKAFKNVKDICFNIQTGKPNT